MIVQFANLQSKHRVGAWRQLLKTGLAAAGEWLPFDRYLARQNSQASLTILFAGATDIRRINREARGVDQVTDVLSFPALEMREGHLQRHLGPADYDLDKGKGNVVPIGEIVICLEQAFRQAAEYGHSQEREVLFLALHGLLHLLGYDHAAEDREKRMLTLQRKIMTRLGYGRKRRSADRTEGTT